MLIEDREARKKFEKTSKDDNEQMWIAFKKLFDDEMKRMRDAHVVSIVVLRIAIVICSSQCLADSKRDI